MRAAGLVLVLLSMAACRGDTAPANTQNKPDPGAGARATANSAPESLPTTPLDLPGAAGALAPAASVGDGPLHLTYLTPAEGSEDAYELLAYDVGTKRVHSVESRPDFIVNWADVPRSHADPSGVLTVAYMVKPYEIRVTRFDPATGESDEPSTPHVGAAHEFGFPSFFLAGDALSLAWLQDGSLRTRALGSQDVPAVLDPRTCECCRTAAATATDGPVLAYRDRGDQEERDTAVVRPGTALGAVTHPGATGWSLAGCPVNGPALASVGNTVALVDFTGKEPPGAVHLHVSHDGGRSFPASQRIDGGKPLGRADVALVDAATAVAVWLEPAPNDPAMAHLMARRASVTAERVRLGPPRRIATTVASRTSGFPVLAARGQALTFVWTNEDAEGTPTLHAATASLADLPK